MYRKKRTRRTRRPMGFTASVKSLFKNKTKRNAMLIGMAVAFISTGSMYGQALASKGQELYNSLKGIGR